MLIVGAKLDNTRFSLLTTKLLKYFLGKENDDEPLPPDELPEHMKPPSEGPPINLENVSVNFSDVVTGFFKSD